MGVGAAWVLCALAVPYAAVTAAPPDPDQGAMQTPARLTVQTDGPRLHVDTGSMAVIFETEHTGSIRSLRVGDRPLVVDHDAPPLSATILHSADYDGWSDHAGGRKSAADFALTDFRHERRGDRFAAVATGHLGVDAEDRLPFELRYEVGAGESDLRVTLSIERRGPFRDRFIHELAFEMPLCLDRRKRIAVGGEDGRSFDTRHVYQFHTSTVPVLLAEPEFNRWEHFAVEQQTPDYYRLWRAESDATSSLLVDHGRRAPGWMGAYDQQGGVLFACGDLAARAPMMLHVRADGGAVARVVLHPATARAFSPDDTAASDRLFGEAHVIDWTFFEGEPQEGSLPREAARLLGRQGDSKAQAIDEPTEPPPPADGDGPLVSGGLPLPRGALREPVRVRLTRERRDLPVQTRPLAYWPDGSVKWLLLVFPLEAGNGRSVPAGAATGDRRSVLPFEVTRRDGTAVGLEMEYGPGVTSPPSRSAIACRRDGDRVEIDTGPLRLVLRTGRSWLSSVALDGREMLDGAPEFFVDYMRPETPYEVATAHADGRLDPGPLAIERLEVEESGPLRAAVCLEGRTLGEEPARVILRLYAYAQRSCVSVTSSVEFMHKDPRQAFVRGMGLRLPLKSGEDAVARLGAGGVNAEPGRAARTGLLQRSHTSSTVWRQAHASGVPSVIGRAGRSRGWIGLADHEGGTAVVLRDAWQQAPVELVAQAESSPSLTVFLKPRSLPLMDVRRYSNFPHRSQGESVTDRNDWAERHYHPAEPFVGISKSHDMLLVFHGPGASAEEIDAVAADYQSRPLMYAGARAYADASVTASLPVPDAERFARTEANLKHVTDFWMFHRDLHGWYGMWDYGDIQHSFRVGYGWVVPPDRLAALLRDPEPRRTRVREKDYFTPHDWACDNGRWGWTNTEALPGLFFQLQYLRTGDRALFFLAEAMARHVRDVDMRHAGQWFGKGTRHGVQHWSDGNHETRQTIHSEFRFHHYLTGDMRSRDFSRRLTEQCYTRGQVQMDADHAGRLYGLLTRWEMTGDPKLAEMLEKYVGCFVTANGIAISPPVRFPEATRDGEGKDDVNGASMFFHHFGTLHALLEYHALTGDAALRDALIRTADHALESGSVKRFAKILAFAALHAEDGARYRDALEQWASGPGARHMFQVVTADRRHWTGPTAFLVDNVAGSFFWLNDVHYVVDVLEREPQPEAGVLEALERREREGEPRRPGRGSWQSEYDRPDLASYLAPPRAAD